MFCEKCGEPCCIDCIAKEHAHHAPFINIEDAAKDAMADIQSYMATLERDVLPSIEKVHWDLKDGIENYNNFLEKAKQDSKRRFQTLRDELDRAEKEWMQQLNDITKTDHTEMERLKNEVEEKRKQTKDMIAACKTAITESSELDLILFKPKYQNISNLEPSNVSLPSLVHLLPLTFQIPKLSELVERIEKEKAETRVEKPKSRATDKEDKLPFTASMVVKTPVNIIDVRGDNIVHTNESVWINNKSTDELTLYNENVHRIKTVPLGFTIFDMALASSNDIIVSDCENESLVRISRSGDVTTLCNTGELRPWGLCINDKQQIVVGLCREYEKQPIKLVIYSPDGSVLLQKMEKYKSRKPLFTKTILQVKQNGNGEYVVSDCDRIVCVSREGEYRWEYRMKKSGYYTPRVHGMVCDRYDNIIIADFGNDIISLLDSEGKLITTLMTSKDGIGDPMSVTIDKQGCLWIGQERNVKVVKYIK